MKYRIYFSEKENLYHVQSKNIFSDWKKRENYFLTDKNGNFKKLSGFQTYGQAEDWMHDRYPILNVLRKKNENENIGFEF